MTLQDYTTEELRAELKRRTELAKAEAEKAKVKRCRMCKHWGEVDYFGNIDNLGLTSTSCRFHKTKNGKYFRCHAPSQLACEYFEPINNKQL